MKMERWMILLFLYGMVGVLLAVALLGRGRGPIARWSQRLFWAAAALWFSGALGGVGLNGVSLAAVSALGAPGYALLMILRAL
ncbi:MAG: hypothetical protein IJ662_12940 [Clostridia bacterium]|nr:hypothetical protein [Clostridia bacterium]